MKQQLPFVIALLFFFLQGDAYGQTNPVQSDTFRIRNYPLKVWYGGKHLRKLKYAEAPLLSLNDGKINRDWKTSKDLRTTGLVTQVIGVVMIGAGLAKSLNSEGQLSGTGLLLGGASVSLGGVIVQIGGVTKAKKAMRRYNKIQAGRAAANPDLSRPEKPQSQAPKTAQKIENEAKAERAPAAPPEHLNRAGIMFGLNGSKMWEIGGSDELRSSDVMRWAWSKPVGVFYELGRVSGKSALVLDLQFLSKGFRLKTETTDGSFSSKVLSDFQLRFLQFGVAHRHYFSEPNARLKAWAQGGVFAAFTLDARLKTRSWAKDSDEKTYLRNIRELELGDEPGQINSKRFDLGAALGCGLAYPLGPGRLSLDARFSLGLLNLENGDDPSPELELPALHTRDTAFWLGYSVPVQ